MFHNKSFCNKLLANILSEIANEISQKQKFFFFERKYLQYLVFSEKQNTIGKKKDKMAFLGESNVIIHSHRLQFSKGKKEKKRKERWYSLFGYCFALPAKEIIFSFREKGRSHISSSSKVGIDTASKEVWWFGCGWYGVKKCSIII